jgi:hypothetical protein
MNKSDMLINLANKLIENNKLVSFGSPMGSQVDIFEVRTKSGKRVLDEFYDGSRFKAFEDLLNNDICYIEYPTSRWTNDGEVSTYDKYMATRSEEIMKKWLGVEELQSRYIKNFSKLTEIGYSYIVKPVQGNGKDKLNKISVPQKPINLEDNKIRIYPLKILGSLFNKFNSMSKDGLVSVSYLKDNKTKRVLNSTMSEEILMKIYNNKDHVDMMLSTATTDLQKATATLERGYVRVVEADSSKYDSGVRALNLARVFEITPIKFEDLDLSYIDVDLDSVISNFSKALRTLNQTELQNLAKVLSSGWKYKYEGGYTVYDIESWVFGKSAIHTTSFNKDLHDLMVSLPNLFKGYTGSRLESVTKPSISNELEEVGEEDDFSIFD